MKEIQTARSFRPCCLRDLGGEPVPFSRFLERCWRITNTAFILTAVECSCEIRRGDDLTEVVSGAGSRALGATVLALKAVRELTFEQVYALRKFRVRYLIVFDGKWTQYEVAQLPLLHFNTRLPEIDARVVEEIYEWAFPTPNPPTPDYEDVDLLSELFTAEELRGER